MHSISKNLKNGVGLGILLIVWIFFFGPMLFAGKVPFDRDFSLVTYPLRHFLHQAYHMQFLPFWNPHVHSGVPFFAELHPGVFYPPSLFFFLDDLTTALNLFYVFHFIFLGASTYLLMRHWRVSVTGSMASALTATLSGFIFASMYLSNYFLAIVWFPAVFLSCRQFLIKRTAGSFLLALFMLASQTLAANPEVSILSCMVIWLHTVSFLGEGTLRNRIRQTGILVGTVALSLGLIAFQLIPTAKLTQQSQRTTEVSFERHGQWSMEMSALQSFVLPQTLPGLMEEGVLPDSSSGFLESVYMGSFSFLFLLLAFWFLRNGPIRFWVTLFLAGIFFALGKNNFMYVQMFEAMPFLNMFRYPEKYFFVSAMSSVFLVGLVWDALISAVADRHLSTRSILLWLLSGAALVGSVALGKTFHSLGMMFALVLFFGTVLLMFYFHRVGARWIQMVFLGLLLLDLTAHNGRLFPLIDRSYYESPPILLEDLQLEPGSSRVYSGRIRQNPDRLLLPNGPTRLSALYAMKEYMYPFMGMIYGVEFADGLTGMGLGLRDQLLWDRYFQKGSWETRIRMLERSNVRHWVNVDPPTPYINKIPLILPDRLQRFDNVLPRAFMVARARVVEPGKVLDVYYSENFDPRAEVVLSTPPRFLPSANFEGTVESIDYGPNRVSLRTRQNSHGYLVLLDSYFPGWTVTVDGQPGPIVRANHFFRAVALGPGEHQLEFQFTPEGWTLGWRVSGASLGGIILLALWARRSPPVEPLKSPSSPENAST